MKKTLSLLLIVIVVFLTCCSSLSDVHSLKDGGKTTNKNSFGYDVDKKDIEYLAELLEASGDLNGAYRLFDTIKADTKRFPKLYSVERKQLSKIECGLKPVIDDSTDESLFDYLIERQLFGFHQYKIGEKGPAGGWVFYDKGYYSDGWRFLEAAPSDRGSTPRAEIRRARWGEDGRFGTSTEIGTGKSNTELILSKSETTETTAATVCLNYSLRGYNDWFLPSRDELDLMYTNLHKKGLGNFCQDSDYTRYWTSSATQLLNLYGAWEQNFANGDQGNYERSDLLCVRPVRAF